MAVPDSDDVKKTLERLKTAQELAGIGSWTMELPDGTLDWSEQMFRILGLDPHEDAPRIETYQKLVHPDDLKIVQRINDETMSKIEGGEGTHRIVRPNGEVRWVRAKSTTITREGEPTLLHGILQDVTEQMKDETEEMLRFQALLDAAPDAMVITDVEGTITYTNKQVQDVFGYAPDELIDEKVEVLVPEQFRAAHPEHRREYHKKPKTRPMGVGLDLAARHKDGHEFPVEISLAPLETNEGRLVMAAVRDVTDRKAAEETQRLAFEQKMQIKQLEETDHFRVNLLNTVAHELNTPLTPLNLQVHLLTKNLDDLSEPHQRAVNIVERNIKRLCLLVSDILDMARMETDKLELRYGPVAAADLVDETLETHREAAAAGKVTLEADVEEGLGFTADGARITQVLYNLVGNAIKFTPPGGTVRVAANSDGGDVVFNVSDTGMGITKEEAKLLFQPFGQVHEQQTQKGTGLGLFISKGITTQHGGTLTMHSKGRSKGTTFTLRIPLQGKP